ncbi:MAG: hypothetical protein NVSMB56_05540 [Pyrinomonadaceae bacterium]
MNQNFYFDSFAEDIFLKSFMTRYITFMLPLLFLFLTFDAAAQKRRAPQKRRSTANNSRSSAAPDARTKLADEIKILTRFLYLYGRSSDSVEATEDQVRRGALPREASAAANQSRASLRSSLQNIREGLDKLEQYFRTTPGLERPYTQLAGVSIAASDAEDLAATNQLDRAGRKLIDITAKLTEALAGMN